MVTIGKIDKPPYVLSCSARYPLVWAFNKKPLKSKLELDSIPKGNVTF
jgi:hypothetical protein